MFCTHVHIRVWQYYFPQLFTPCRLPFLLENYASHRTLLLAHLQGFCDCGVLPHCIDVCSGPWDSLEWMQCKHVTYTKPEQQCLEQLCRLAQCFTFSLCHKHILGWGCYLRQSSGMTNYLERSCSPSTDWKRELQPRTEPPLMNSLHVHNEELTFVLTALRFWAVCYYNINWPRMTNRYVYVFGLIR